MSLKSIIANMIVRAQNKPGRLITENLGKGLTVQMQADEEKRLSLSLRRYGKFPSDREKQIVLLSFPWSAVVHNWDRHADRYNYYWMIGRVELRPEKQLDLFTGGGDGQPAEPTG